MTLEAFFRKLGAPLNNTLWSWGAIGKDGTVYLRVWQDETKKIEGKLYVRVFLSGVHEDGNLGNNERINHLEMIGNGSKCFLIMCIVKDINAPKRLITRYIKNELFVGGSLMKLGDDIWIEIIDRVPVSTK
jgi:hypothetical protein